MYERRWVCEVFTNGYHNGCTCNPREPHGNWECGYRWVAPTIADTDDGKLFAERVNWFIREMEEQHGPS